MKKTLLIFLVFIFTLETQAQENLKIPTEFPTEFDSNFTFPLGSKILIELKENNDGVFTYRVLEIRPIDGYYSFEKDEILFVENPKVNTVEIFFMGAYYNDGSEDEDWKTLIMMRNNMETPITYSADIKYYYSDKFENTSIVGAFPNVKTNEIWSHKIDFITLYDFKELKTE